MRTLRRLARRPGAGWLALAAAPGRRGRAGQRAGAVPAPSGPPVLVARVPIPAGTLLDETAARASLASAPAPAGLHLTGCCTPPRRRSGAGRPCRSPPASRSPRRRSGGAAGLGPGPLRPGERAVPVPLSAAGGAAAGLAPGSRVDVAASTGEGPAARTAIVVSDAEVLAVGAGADAAGVGGEAGSALLRVSARGALRLTSALNFARDVRLLVRPAGEAP